MQKPVSMLNALNSLHKFSVGIEIKKLAYYKCMLYILATKQANPAGLASNFICISK